MLGALGHAFRLLASGDRELYFIAFTSVRFAAASTCLSAALALPAGVLLGLKEFAGKRAVVTVLNTLMALPTVVVGLAVYSLLTRTGPLGTLRLLFTPAAVIGGQTVLAFPIITALVYGALSKVDPRLPETLVTLGGSTRHLFWMTLREARLAILSALVAGFGRVIGEVGVSMMLGGNIRWYTRTITTAVALETSKGEFELGLALGFVLLAIALGVNAFLHWAVRREP